jgi:outer membrane protein assembly factor BamB
MKEFAIFLTAFALIACAGLAHAGDSPQFRGPNRDGCFDEKGLLKTWPESGPALLWKCKGLGKGYSSVSVVKDKLYTSGMSEDNTGSLFILNTDGAVEKKIPYGPETLNKQAPGTRSTPTIDGDRAYLLSGLGVLYCFDLTKGEKLWEVNTLERFGAETISWDIAESPLIDGENVIFTPGGKDATFAALNKKTGATVWTTKGLADKTSYCSPVIVTYASKRLLLGETGGNIVCADPDTGDLLWNYEQKAPWDIHANTPIYSDGCIYYTAGSKAGGGLLALSQDASSVTSKWKDKNLDCLHHGVILADGYLYGTGEKNSYLMCLEFATGNLAWSSKEVGQGAIILADGMLYIYEGPEAGVVDLVKATSSGFERAGRFKITDGEAQHWAHPVVANGALYIRHGDVLMAYDVKQR